MNTSFKDSLTQNNRSAESTSNAEWRARLAYKCGFCGKEYNSIKDRAECEIKCFKKKEEEERLAAEKKKMEEQAIRKAEVDEAIARAEELKNKYVEDYGTYVRVRTCHVDEIDDLFSYIDLFNRLP